MRSARNTFAAAVALLCLCSQSSWARTPEEEASFKLGASVMRETVYALNNASKPPTVTPDPIALALHECEDEPGDYGTCMQHAYEAYDRLLNQLYKLALDENGEQAGHALRAAQRRWLAFQKADDEARMAYGSQENRRASVVGWAGGNQRIAAIRQRIAQLMFFLGADQE